MASAPPPSSPEACLPTWTLKTLGSSSVTWQNSAYSLPTPAVTERSGRPSFALKETKWSFLSTVSNHEQHENKDPEKGWGTK